MRCENSPKRTLELSVFCSNFFWVNCWVFKIVIYAFNTYRRFCDKDCPNSQYFYSRFQYVSKFLFQFNFFDRKICLNFFVDDCQLGYITKLKKNWNLALEIFPFFLFCDLVRLAIIHKKIRKFLL
jgi:hypothetical protein